MALFQRSEMDQETLKPLPPGPQIDEDLDNFMKALDDLTGGPDAPTPMYSPSTISPSESTRISKEPFKDKSERPQVRVIRFPTNVIIQFTHYA